MRLGETLRSLVTQDATTRVEAARTLIAEGHPHMARWHLDQVVAQAPERAETVADWCVALEQPRLAKRYYKRAVAAGTPPASAVVWQLGRQYLALAAAEPQRKKAESLHRKGMEALGRAESLAPQAYGPRASRLRTLLEQFSREHLGCSWSQARGRQGAYMPFVDRHSLRQIYEALTAAQTVRPDASELTAVTTLLREQDQPRTFQDGLSVPVLLPLLLAHLARPERNEALDRAALAALAGIAGQCPEAAVGPAASAYAQSGKLTLGTLEAFVHAYGQWAAWHQPSCDKVVEALWKVMQQADPAVSAALVDLLTQQRQVRVPQSAAPPTTLADPLVALPPDEGWEQSVLGPMLSADRVLDLDAPAALQACALLDAPSAALLSTHLSRAQRAALNALPACA